MRELLLNFEPNIETKLDTVASHQYYKYLHFKLRDAAALKSKHGESETTMNRTNSERNTIG